MKEKLLRYATVKELLETRKITALDQIFEFVPYRIVAQDLKLEEERLRLIIAETREMKMIELFNLAQLIGCPEEILVNLAADKYLSKKKG